MIETDALRSSEGSLTLFEFKKMNKPKVVENAVVNVRLDFLNPACPTLEESELPISVLTSETLSGCSRLTSLKLLDTNIGTLGTYVFKHLVNTMYITFSADSKFWVQTGAFQNLENLGSVAFEGAPNHGDEYSMSEEEESDHHNLKGPYHLEK